MITSIFLVLSLRGSDFFWGDLFPGLTPWAKTCFALTGWCNDWQQIGDQRSAYFARSSFVSFVVNKEFAPGGKGR